MVPFSTKGEIADIKLGKEKCWLLNSSHISGIKQTVWKLWAWESRVLITYPALSLYFINTSVLILMSAQVIVCHTLTSWTVMLGCLLTLFEQTHHLLWTSYIGLLSFCKFWAQMSSCIVSRHHLRYQQHYHVRPLYESIITFEKLIYRNSYKGVGWPSSTSREMLF